MRFLSQAAFQRDPIAKLSLEIKEQLSFVNPMVNGNGRFRSFRGWGKQ